MGICGHSWKGSDPFFSRLTRERGVSRLVTLVAQSSIRSTACTYLAEKTALLEYHPTLIGPCQSRTSVYLRVPAQRLASDNGPPANTTKARAGNKSPLSPEYRGEGRTFAAARLTGIHSAERAKQCRISYEGIAKIPGEAPIQSATRHRREVRVRSNEQSSTAVTNSPGTGLLRRWRLLLVLFVLLCTFGIAARWYLRSQQATDLVRAALAGFLWRAPSSCDRGIGPGKFLHPGAATLSGRVPTFRRSLVGH